jgi:hypothetical protein
MEEAEELHVAAKPLFASLLRAPGGDANVKKKFIANAPGGVERFEALMKRAASLWEQTARQLSACWTACRGQAAFQRIEGRFFVLAHSRR